MNKVSGRLISTLYISICATGFTYQVAVLNAQYFRYGTNTRVTADILRFTYSPYLHLCPYMWDVIDIAAYNRDRNTSLKRDMSVHLFHSTFTIKDLLNYTPRVDDLISSCRLRRPGTNDFSRYEETDCHEVFHVLKYVTLEFVCYQISLIPLENDLKYDFNKMAYAQYYPGNYYIVRLTDHWVKYMGTCKVMSVERREGEDKSMSTAPSLTRKALNGSLLYNFFSVLHAKVLYHRKPPPYDTMCRDYISQGLRSGTGCANTCLLRMYLKMFDRLWHASKHVEPIDKLSISRYVLRKTNDSLTGIFDEIFEHCQNACAQLECAAAWSLTTAESESYGAGVTLTTTVPKQASIVVAFEAALTIESYIIFIMSCFGSWFGLSALSFNPLNLKRFQHSQQQEHISLRKLKADVAMLKTFLPVPTQLQPVAYRLGQKLVSALFLCVCAAGFAFQVGELSGEYFSYETMTRIATDILRFTYAPDVHICPKTSQMFNITAYNEAKNSTVLTRIENIDETQIFQSMMTVADLFAYTPSSMDMIDNCMVRRPHSNGFTVYDRNYCNNMFYVTKYFTMEYICYQVQLIPLKDDMSYDTNRIGFALNYQGTFYYFTLADQWKTLLNDLKIMSIERGAYIDKSLPVSMLISRGYQKGNSMYNLFFARNSRVRYVRMPPPYKSMCRDYIKDGLRSSLGCSNECMRIRSLKHFGMFWYGSQAYSPLPERPLSANDFKNVTYRRVFAVIYNECHDMCRQNECNITWSLTSVNQRKSGEGLRFSAVMGSQPSFTVEHEPKLTMENYLIFIMSCIGSWFGLSVLSFNPMNLKQRKAKGKDGAVGLTACRTDPLFKGMVRLQHELNSIKKFVSVDGQMAPIRYKTPPGGKTFRF
ncbi:hypothetical protein HDE_01921 [Halotydeus destructor]|nr:hypothetical protein HDE_01921 [Halotydeus destructor]